MRVLFTPAYTGSPICKSQYLNRSGMPLDTFDSLDGLIKDNEWVTPNNGNIIHSESSAKIFQCDRNLSAMGRAPGFKEVDTPQQIEKKISLIKKDFDSIVLNFANIIHKKDKLTDEAFKKLEGGFSSTATLVENLDGVQIFAYGVGLQDEMVGDKNLIGPQIYRLLKALNEKAVVFGTRGDTTKKFLNELGFNNAKALGCPSMYVNPSATANLKPASINENVKVAAAGRLSISGLNTGRIQPIFEVAKKYDTDYTFQNDLFGLVPKAKLADVGYNSESHEVAKAATEAFIIQKLKGASNFSRYYYFRSPQAWRAYSATRDIYIGDRFHGGVAFLQVGLPAGFIYDDVRVLELTGFYGLQAFKPEEVLDMGPQETLNIITSKESLEKFKDVYSSKKAQFSSINKESGFLTKF